MNNIKIITLSLSFFQVAYRFYNNTLQTIFFNDKQNLQPKLQSIYLARIIKKQLSLGCFLLDLGNNQQALLKITKNSSTFHEGQKVLVQVVKEPTTPNKHAVVTEDLNIASPLLVYKPLARGIIFAKNIPSSDYPKITTTLKLNDEGIVIRSSYKHNLLPNLQTSLQNLRELYQSLQQCTKVGVAYQPHFLSRLISNNSKLIPNTIILDEIEDVSFCKNFLQQHDYLPTQLKIKDDNNAKYSPEVLLNYLQELIQPVFQINKELSLNYFETEAFNYIDVNYKGSYNVISKKEEALYKANLSVLESIAYNIMLKNLSGQILVDVLKITGKQYKHNLLKSLQKYFLIDDNKTTVLGFSNLGIMEIARQKVTDSLSIYTKTNFNYKVFQLFIQIINVAKARPTASINIICTKAQHNAILQLASTEVTNVNSWLSKPLGFIINESSKVPILQIR